MAGSVKSWPQTSRMAFTGIQAPSVIQESCRASGNQRLFVYGELFLFLFLSFSLF
ncbi:hypothetical protein CSHISOI_06693 [Colletotrichum shisoi]|uniref:Uncharacterized protein n=1 Tax=Colletotrichum shisoi TaxID=2078593 RepID=A0A5Q4BP80_9PEZI|nr:hypothetical protein CSHISOI_06693 [Colletotrichum shisoi]